MNAEATLFLAKTVNVWGHNITNAINLWGVLIFVVLLLNVVVKVGKK